MKKVIFYTLLFLLSSISTKLIAQCSLLNPVVSINGTSQDGAGNCVIDFNLAFDFIDNGGNKRIFTHFWLTGDYPSPALAYVNAPTAVELSASSLNLVIDNFADPIVFLNTYSPASSVPVQSPVNNPALAIQKTASSVLGADRYIISNLKITLPNAACSNSVILKGDIWSTQANAPNPTVHCFVSGFAIALNDPTVGGGCLNNNPRQYNFTISTIENSLQVYYDVYLDNGNNIFDPANDQIILSLSEANAVTITPATAYNSGPILYPSPLDAITNKLYVVVHTVGAQYLISSEILPCIGGPLPITLRNFSAIRKNNSLVYVSWQTESEINAASFDIERKVGNSFIKVGSVSASGIAGGSSYSYNSSNVEKSISLYRLKMIDKDGKYKYSDVKSVKGISARTDFTIFPNPSPSGNTKVSISDVAGPLDIQLIDNTGRVLATKSLKNTSEVEFNNLKKGFYLIRITNQNTGEMNTKKLTVN